MRTGLLMLLLGLSLTARSSAETATLSELDWLAGCWVAVTDESTNEECWLYPAGDRMLAINRTVDGKGGAFEFLRIEQRDGQIVYLASPGGREPVPFRLTYSTAGKAVFENPQHDFPQRITYTRDGDRLSVRVEARRGEDWGGFSTDWARGQLTAAPER